MKHSNRAMFTSMLSATAASVLLTFAAPQAHAKDLTIALGSNVATLDPTNAQVVGIDVSLMAELYSSLTRREADGKIVGDLALWANPALAKARLAG